MWNKKNINMSNNILAKIYKLCVKFMQETHAQMSDIIAGLLGFSLLVFVVVPFVIEVVLIYYQGQELERLVGTAATQACSLLPNNANNNIANQGSLGAMLNVNQVTSIMSNVVANTFQEQAFNPVRYQGNWKLQIYDVLDNNITQGASNYPAGFIGASPARQLCPTSKDPNASSNWCLQSNSAAQIKESFKDGELGNLNQASQNTGVPSSLRQEMLQFGRTLNTSNTQYMKSLEGVLYKCVVAVDLPVIHLFGSIGAGNSFIGLTSSLFPSVLSKQASATFKYENSAPVEHNAYNTSTQLLPHYQQYQMVMTDNMTDCANNPNCINNRNLSQINEKTADGNDKIDTHDSIPEDFFDDTRELDKAVPNL